MVLINGRLEQEEIKMLGDILDIDGTKYVEVQRNEDDKSNCINCVFDERCDHINHNVISCDIASTVYIEYKPIRKEK